jgi:hypothetical protein
MGSHYEASDKESNRNAEETCGEDSRADSSYGSSRNPIFRTENVLPTATIQNRYALAPEPHSAFRLSFSPKLCQNLVFSKSVPQAAQHINSTGEKYSECIRSLHGFRGNGRIISSACTLINQAGGGGIMFYRYTVPKYFLGGIVRSCNALNNRRLVGSRRCRDKVFRLRRPPLAYSRDVVCGIIWKERPQNRSVHYVRCTIFVRVQVGPVGDAHRAEVRAANAEITRNANRSPRWKVGYFEGIIAVEVRGDHAEIIVTCYGCVAVASEVCWVAAAPRIPKFWGTQDQSRRVDKAVRVGPVSILVPPRSSRIGRNPPALRRGWPHFVSSQTACASNHRHAHRSSATIGI